MKALTHFIHINHPNGFTKQCSLKAIFLKYLHCGNGRQSTHSKEKGMTNFPDPLRVTQQSLVLIASSKKLIIIVINNNNNKTLEVYYLVHLTTQECPMMSESTRWLEFEVYMANLKREKGGGEKALI